MVNQGSDPSIPYAFAQRREDVQNSYRNPMGAYTSAATRDAANRVANKSMSMGENQAIQASNFANNQAAFGRQATVAQATMPFQTGGVQIQQTPFNPMSIIGPAAQIGSAALTKGASAGI